MATNPGQVPTLLVATRGPLDVPESYVVPGSQELKLSSVSAEFDGTGAGGPFEATLSLYSQDDQLLSRTVAGDTIAAGSSGVATWYPFRRRVAVAAGGGITDVFKVYKTVNQVINDGVTANISFDAADVTVGTPYTTPDDIEFDCEAGVWQFGFQLRVTGSNPGSTGELRAVLREINGPTEFAEDDHFESVSGAVTSRFAVAAESPWDGTGTPPSILVRVTNTLGYNATIEAGLARTFLWGIRVVSP